ncbi:Nicotine blue oxidoreductase [Emticicia aquatica]|jgi:molybdenum cofactor cytidylyltransferase|uniref:Nicotine blue oxidoreductase n=1 Tax=Emticicia aquatica TaxID=1681835 RepID=A0ABM9ANF0_9BACT|nr:nucleotidyltransferase family protein [Emticicia aquatica]CAH0995016.1 Nicotine blue oxidoreductase [Emticicia aquatica]
MNTSIIILAAGASSRMGAPKQLLLVDGKTLIKRVAEVAIDTPCHPIVTVLGANRHLIRKEIEKIPITVIDNPQWENGMSSSIKMGLVGTYMTQKEMDAVIFLTVDMPFVTARLINEMIEKATENPEIEIVACKYDNQVGIPVLFKRPLFNDLLELKGDEGAKKIVLKNKEKTALIDFPEGKFDLDTIDEYRNFVSNYNSN